MRTPPNEPDAAHLEEIGDALGRIAVDLVFDALDLDEVVGDEHMPAVDELECGLGLADAAVTDEQDAYAADVEQLAVDGVAGCERGGEIVHHVALNGGGGLVADKERSGMPFGDMLHVFRDGVLVRDDDAGHAF